MLKFFKLKPKTLQLEVTNDCNSNCLICMRVTSKRKVGYISLDDFLKIPFENFKEVAFHGWGEPLLHPKLFEMVKIASDKGVTTSLITNGLILDKKLDDILNSNLDSIAFGIFTTKGKEKVFKNISEFVKRNNSIKNFIDITILPENLEDIKRIVTFAGENGLDVVLHKLFYAHNPSLSPLPREKIKLACKIAKEIGKDYGIKIYTPPKQTRPCAVALSCIFLSWDFVASPCCFLHEMGFHYPDLSFDKHRKFLLEMKKNEICKKCPW